MNLRGRTIEPLQRPKPEVKSFKNKPCRRSVRNKTVGKDDKLSPNKSKETQHKENFKETRPRAKRRYSKKSGKKTSQADVFSKPYFPPVEETGIKEVIEEFKLLSPEDSHLINEVTVIYECRACHEFFRSLGSYLVHKQSTCTSLVRTRMHPGNKNPFVTTEICSLYEEDSEEESLTYISETKQLMI